MRLRVALTSIAAAAFLVAGSSGHAAPPAKLFLSPSGSDAGKCTAAAPCRTLAHAYAVASPGATVQMADGLYGCQGIRGTKSAVVTFTAASGAVPRVTCELKIDATNIVFSNLRLAGVRSSSLQNVTLRNVAVTCEDTPPYALWGGKCSAGVFLFNNVNGFKMLGGSVGPTWDDTYDGAPGQSQVGITLNGCNGCTVRNITFDGVRFHDNRRIDDQQHTSCLMLGGGTNVVIRNSQFTNCAVFDLFVTWWNFVSPQYAPGTGIVLENNRFDAAVAGCSGCTAGYFSVEFADYPPVWRNVLIRDNSAAQQMNFDGTHDNFVVRDNAIVEVAYSCKRDVTYVANVVTGTPCSSTDKRVRDLTAVPAAAAANYPAWPPPLPGERRAKSAFSIFPSATGSRRCRVPRGSLSRRGHGAVSGTCTTSVSVGTTRIVVSLRADWQLRGRSPASHTWRVIETVSGRPIAVRSSGSPLPTG